MDTGHSQQQFMAPREVCALLHIAPSTLKRWTDAGRLVAVRHANGHRRFLASSPAIVSVQQQLQDIDR